MRIHCRIQMEYDYPEKIVDLIKQETGLTTDKEVLDYVYKREVEGVNNSIGSQMALLNTICENIKITQDINDDKGNHRP